VNAAEAEKRRTGRRRRLTDAQIEEIRASLKQKKELWTLRQWAEHYHMSESGLAFVLREGYKQPDDGPMEDTEDDAQEAPAVTEDT